MEDAITTYRSEIEPGAIKKVEHAITTYRSEIEAGAIKKVSALLRLTDMK